MELGRDGLRFVTELVIEPEFRLPARTPPFFAHFTDFTLGTCTPALASMLTANFQNVIHARARRAPLHVTKEKKLKKFLGTHPRLPS